LGIGLIGRIDWLKFFTRLEEGGLKGLGVKKWGGELGGILGLEVLGWTPN